MKCQCDEMLPDDPAHAFCGPCGEAIAELIKKAEDWNDCTEPTSDPHDMALRMAINDYRLLFVDDDE